MLRPLCFLLFFTFASACSGQLDLEDATEKAQEKKKEIVGDDDALSEEEIVDGLKEALEVGAEESAEKASAVDGFNKNPKIRIPFPPEAEEVKEKAMDVGMEGKVKTFEKKMNRAAEKASEKATPIFVDAVKQMSVKEGKEILEGKDDAATRYLEEATHDTLEAEFKPVVEDAMEDVRVAKYWQPLASTYNQSTTLSGKEKVDPDLEQYITDRALDGLFVLIAEKEAEIREDPAARVTELLKEVFGSQDD